MFGIIVSFLGGVAAIEMHRNYPRVRGFIPVGHPYLGRFVPFEHIIAVGGPAFVGFILGSLTIGDTTQTFHMGPLGVALLLTVLGAFYRQMLQGVSTGLAVAVREASRHVGRLAGKVIVYGGAALAALWGVSILAATPGGADLTAVLLVLGGIIWFASNRLFGRGRGNQGRGH